MNSKNSSFSGVKFPVGRLLTWEKTVIGYVGGEALDDDS